LGALQGFTGAHEEGAEDGSGSAADGSQQAGAGVEKDIFDVVKCLNFQHVVHGFKAARHTDAVVAVADGLVGLGEHVFAGDHALGDEAESVLHLC